MDEKLMRERLKALSARNDLTELMNLTIYDVSREISRNSQHNIQMEFHVKESFNNKPPKNIHYLFRADDADAMELYSLLLRMEVSEEEASKVLLPE